MGKGGNRVKGEFLGNNQEESPFEKRKGRNLGAVYPPSATKKKISFDEEYTSYTGT